VLREYWRAGDDGYDYSIDAEPPAEWRTNLSCLEGALLSAHAGLEGEANVRDVIAGKDAFAGQPGVAAAGDRTELLLGFPARWTRSENPLPFSNGSTVAVTSKTGYLTVASP
jgi:hypothetical protein